MNEADKKMIDEIVGYVCFSKTPNEELVRQAVMTCYKIGETAGLRGAVKVSLPVAKATIS
jgi:hypothetical protein